MADCKRCENRGFVLVKVENPYTKKSYMGRVDCYCTKAKRVSNEEILLNHIGELEYLAFDKMDKRLNKFDRTNWTLEEIPNYIIRDKTNSLDFCGNIKSFIMMYRYAPKAMNILLTSGINIVHDFFVKQDEGYSPRLSSLLKYDLVIMSFNTLENNKALKGCVAQVVSARLWNRQPTWIYVPRGELQKTLEYSDELASFLDPKDFKEITIECDWSNREKGLVTVNKPKMDLGEMRI